MATYNPTQQVNMDTLTQRPDWEELKSQITGGLASTAGRARIAENAGKLGYSYDQLAGVVNKAAGDKAAFNAQDAAAWEPAGAVVSPEQVGRGQNNFDSTNTPDWNQLNNEIRANWGTPEGRAAIFTRGKTLGLDEGQMADAVSRATGTYYGPTDIAGWGGKTVMGTKVAKPVVPKTPYGGLTQQYSPVLDRRVDAPKETIEGRISNILRRDAAGNYTNDVVRQAVERATQNFAKRGLVNTSMAAQAGQEAAIAKAIEIAGPDAERYFQQGRANQDASNVFARDETQQAYNERNNLSQWEQDRSMQADRLSADAALQSQRLDQDRDLTELDQSFRERQLTNEQAFNLRQNYITAQDRISQSYQRMVDTINTSQMTPEDKTAAIANAAQIRDSESAYINSVFSRQPQWSQEWLAMSVQVGGANIATMTDINTLAVIAADPAQPQSVRAQAQARLAELEANPPAPTPAPTPSPTPAPSWSDGP